MAKRKRYLTMDEKRQLALEGKPVPICVYPEYKAEKRRKKVSNFLVQFKN